MSVFNGERYLEECIDSILAQTFRDFEFVIIDDGSTDRTAAILGSYQRIDPRVLVFHQENQGAAESWNRGCGLAQGKYLARMDADDVALSDRLMRQIEFLESHAEVGLLGGALDFIDSNGKTLCPRRYPLEDHNIRPLLLRESPFAHPAIVMRKELFFSVGGYRTVFADTADYDLWLRMAARCQLANLGEVVLKYRIHPGQVSCHKLRQQCLSALAAQAVAASNGAGGEDRLASVKEITVDVLAGLGVAEATVQSTLATFYLGQIDLMCRVGQQPTALRLTIEMLRSSRWEHIEKRKRFIADNWLRATGLYWGQGQFLRSLAAAIQAVIIRPAVVGRPAKRLLGQVTSAFGAGKRRNAPGINSG
jgi:hypothetical protein